MGSEDKIGLIRIYRDQVTINQSVIRIYGQRGQDWAHLDLRGSGNNQSSGSMGSEDKIGIIRIYRDQVTISQSSRSMGSEDKIGLIRVYRDQVTISGSQSSGSTGIR
jgi:hypothetical protein